MLTPLVYLIAIVVVGFLIWLLMSLFSKNRVSKYGFALATGGLLFLLFFPKPNPLKKYGFDYRFESNASPTLMTIDFFINSNHGEIKGPCIIGDGLIIKFQDLEKTGIEDIIITAEGHSASKIVIKPLLKDGRGVGFHILESRGMCLGYREEGYMCP
jgi:hypothetical protein